MRGLWRSWEANGGRDVWRARVEIQVGKWSDVEISEYERAGCQPPFWDLPRKEDYMATAFADPARERVQKWQRNAMPPVIVGIIIGGGALFLAVIFWSALVPALNR